MSTNANETKSTTETETTSEDKPTEETTTTTTVVVIEEKPLPPRDVEIKAETTEVNGEKQTESN